MGAPVRACSTVGRERRLVSARSRVPLHLQTLNGFDSFLAVYVALIVLGIIGYMSWRSVMTYGLRQISPVNTAGFSRTPRRESRISQAARATL
jgi:hypothetical protein